MIIFAFKIKFNDYLLNINYKLLVEILSIYNNNSGNICNLGCKNLSSGVILSTFKIFHY